MKKIKILLTFDYELPLGSSRDYNAGLFAPARRLVDLANQLQVPIVLFADVCSAIRFKDWDRTNYYIPFKDQLQGALEMGHDIQLHIHPHWMNSAFEDNKFKPSPDFSLSSFRDNPEGYSIEGIIQESFDELNSILREVQTDFRCIAFRAGGYDVEPESKRILNKLHELGIRIESSVIRNFYLDYTFSKIDYSKAPRSSYWFIPKDGPLIKSTDTGLLELPISSKPTHVLDIIARRFKKMLHKKAYQSRRYNNGGKGYLDISGGQGLLSAYRKITNPMVLTFDREYRSVADLESIVAYNVNQYSSEKNDLYLTAIAHPKSMGDYHLSLMRGFVEKMRTVYTDQVEFITYKQVLTDFGL